MCEGRKTESGDSREPADEAQSESAALRTREDIQRLLVGLREDCAAIERAKAWLDKQPPDPMVHLLNREPGRSPAAAFVTILQLLRYLATPQVATPKVLPYCYHIGSTITKLLRYEIYSKISR